MIKKIESKAFYHGKEVEITGFDQVDQTVRILQNDEEIDVPMDDILVFSLEA